MRAATDLAVFLFMHVSGISQMNAALSPLWGSDMPFVAARQAISPCRWSRWVRRARQGFPERCHVHEGRGQPATFDLQQLARLAALEAARREPGCVTLDELKAIAAREGLHLVTCPPCIGTKGIRYSGR
jgi:hypothetical protein